MRYPNYEHLRPDPPRSGLIFLCDHAGNALPDGYATLGLPAELLGTHIAYDIGAADVVRRFAKRFAAQAILGRWSRLLIDLNRGEDDPTLVMKLSDGSVIPGNRNAGPDEITHRISTYHAPYHAAIRDAIAQVRALGYSPVLVSIHSFTPVWKGVARPWQLAVLWDRDDRLSRPLLSRLATAGFVVGDNEPYAGGLRNDTLDRHGTANGLPHALIEIRQDQIATPTTAHAMADRLEPLLREALADLVAQRR